MRVAVRLVIASVLLAGCASSGANHLSAGYCDSLTQVKSVLQGWPLKSMTVRQATTALDKAYIELAKAGDNDFGGRVQLNVTAFSDDVRWLHSAIANGAGVDAAMATIRQAIPSVPACQR